LLGFKNSPQPTSCYLNIKVNGIDQGTNLLSAGINRINVAADVGEVINSIEIKPYNYLTDTTPTSVTSGMIFGAFWYN
jgi:hypothetical protein